MKDMDKNGENNHTCSFCGKAISEVELLIAGPKDIMICNECIRQCETILAEKNSGDIYLRPVYGPQEKQEEKLRPITRMPKKWLVYDVNPYATIPYVIGCDSSGEKRENFSIPKQLARWMITADNTVDIDELKKDIKDELTSTVMAALKLY